MAIKILIGGSPCTYWSIAKTNNRETKAEGMGWELFKNYLIAKEKFKPDFFLYENNKSASQAIKDQIAEEFGVGVDPDVRFTYINSALVSAQNRQRFYVTNFGDIEQPKDRGILLKDILETGQGQRNQDKARTLTAGYTCKSQRDLRKDIETDGFMGAQGVIEPVNPTIEGKAHTLTAPYYKIAENPFSTFGNEKGRQRIFEKVCDYGATPCEWDENGKPTKAISCADGKTYTVYEAKDGQITIKGKQYPIKLSDGYYIIRKLTVRECARLQTMPDDYCKAVSDSQAYKALGNGWTAEVIIHLLNHALKDVPRDEEIIVLSLYDGIATGRYCLDKMGFTNVKYHAYEIDKYPIMVAMDNYPDIIQHGDAFAVREDDWKPPQTRSEWLDELLGGGR